MNLCVLIGNITKDITIAKTTSNISVVQNTIAVKTNAKNKDGEFGTNFINFVAFNKTAELIAEHFQKGDRIGLIGEWQVRSYQAKDGSTRYVNELVVNNIEFLQQKREDQPKPEEPKQEEPKSRFSDDLDDEDLPF